MWTYNYSNELYHYGVKGMRWGVRHDRRATSAERKIGRINSKTDRLNKKLGKLERKKQKVSYAITREKYLSSQPSLAASHFNRNALNTNIPKNEAEAAKQGWVKLSDSASSMHQMYKEDGVRNTKWISPDGHREAVYTGKGKNQHLTTHAEDAASYNFYDYRKNPLGHAAFDVMPYMVFGNSLDDRSTARVRMWTAAKNFSTTAAKDASRKAINSGKKFAKKYKLS